jgi:hypothetical protein
MHARSSECALEGEKTMESHENRENCSKEQKPNSDISESGIEDKVSMLNIVLLVSVWGLLKKGSVF